MRGARVTLALVWMAGCAQGVAPGAGGDDVVDPVDAAITDEADGRVADATVDAVTGPITLSQTTTDAITTSVRACRNGFGANAGYSYFRAFALPTHGIAGPFEVSRVDFAVQSATSGLGAKQPAEVRLYTASGEPRVGGLTSLHTEAIEIENSRGGMVAAPIAATVPAGATLVVELAIPDGRFSGHAFAMGANSDGESAPGYWRSSPCDVADLTALASGTTPAHIVLTVTGTPR